MRAFDAKDWYWRVAASETQVYHSAIGDFVSVNNAAYAAFLADGNLPTPIASNTELSERLAEDSLRPVNANVLAGYREKQATMFTLAIAAKLSFQQENRIRAIERALGLNGSPANLGTAAQFKNFIRDEVI
jgi:hypothetical protein